MSEPQITRQKGAASSDRGFLFRWLQMQVMTRKTSESYLVRQRQDAERARIKASKPHEITLFYQVGDPYSYLLIQALKNIAHSWNADLIFKLTSGVSGNNNPEPDMLVNLAIKDAAFVAPGYGLQFSQVGNPTQVAIKNATCRLAPFADARNPDLEAIETISRQLWEGAFDSHDVNDKQWQEAQAIVTQGSKEQDGMGHYAGAMLHYGGEWYWGVDRLYHLESRLRELGVCDQSRYPRPPITPNAKLHGQGYRLECYPSLRSPYSAICFDAVCTIADQTGIELVLKPVLPMVMRGVTLTRTKGFYIMIDCAREARTLNKKGYGHFFDPIGDGVIRGFSIYPLAKAKGVERAYLKSFMDGAFCEGINTLSDRGLKRICERAGLPWKEAKQYLGKPGWGEELEQNRQDMYAWGSWGVPSFRLLGPDGETVAEAWGQDRLWRFVQIIDALAEH